MTMQTEQAGRIFCHSFADGSVVRVSRVRELPSGDYRGQVDLLEGDVLRHSSTANLCTASARQAITKSTNGSKHDWAGMLDAALSETVRRLTMGAAAVVIRSEDPAPQHRFLIEPLLPFGEPTVVYGAGGSSKSFLALLLAVMAQLPYSDNPLGWKAPKLPVNVLYGDNETSQATIHRRLQQIQRGMGLPHVHIVYRSLTNLLTTEIEALQAAIMQHEIKLLIVDSVARAAGGDMFGPAAASDLFTAVRQLGVTTLLIHHESKGSPGEAATSFGSVYFKNNARMEWHLERTRDSAESGFDVKLTNTKFNDGPLHEPIGLRLTFGMSPEGQSLKFEKCDLAQTEFADRLPLRRRIADLLTSGKLPVADIAAELDENEHTVRTVLNRNKQTFTKVGHTWGLKE